MSSDALKQAGLGRASRPSFFDDSLSEFVGRFVVPGFVATVLIGIGALGVGWMPLDTSLASTPLVGVFRGSSLGVVVSVMSMAAGICLLLFAWLQFGKGVAAGVITDLRQQWLALGAWALPLLFVPPLFSRDVYSYVAQGRLMDQNINPYEFGPSVMPGALIDGVDPLWADAPAPYGQIFLIVAQVIAFATGDNVYLGAILFRLLAVGGVALLAWSVPKLAEFCGADPGKAMWIAVLNPLIFVHFIAGAHNDALMVGVIAAGLALIVGRHPVWGLLVVSLGGAIKGTGLIALPFAGLLWVGPKASPRRKIWSWVVAGSFGASVLLLFAWVTGTGFTWLSAMSAPSEVRTWLSPPTAIGMLLGYPLELINPDYFSMSVDIVRLVSTLAGLALIVYLCLRPPGGSAIRALALSLLVVVIFGPVAQPWYILWSLPFFAAAGLTARESKVVVVGTVGLSLFSLGGHFLDGIFYR